MTVAKQRRRTCREDMLVRGPGNTSSNSSSNSSTGVHTRVGTIISDDGRGRRIYERREYRGRVEEPRRVRRRARDDFDD
jgi:hypothetical protein